MAALLRKGLFFALLLGAAPATMAAEIDLSIHPPIVAGAGAAGSTSKGAKRSQYLRAAPPQQQLQQEVLAVHNATTEAVVAPQPQASMVDMLAAESRPAAALPPSGEAMVTELQQERDEVRQHRTNIAQLQQTLTADVALLREGSALQRASATQESRTMAKLQVRRTEQVVKDLSSMLRDSRAEAIEDAKALLQQAKEVRSAADDLAREASNEIQLLSSKTASAAGAIARPGGHHRHTSPTVAATAVPEDAARAVAKAVALPVAAATVAPPRAVLEAPAMAAVGPAAAALAVPKNGTAAVAAKTAASSSSVSSDAADADLDDDE